MAAKKKPEGITTLSEAKLGEGVIPTGIPSLDHILGGGFPRGQICEVSGAEGGGKSTLMYQVMREAQRGGGVALYADAENRINREYVITLGIDPKKLLLIRGGYAEEILGKMQEAIESKQVTIAVLDSIAALVPKAELDAEMSEQQMGLQARIMGKACRKMAGSVAQTNTALILVNQIREKTGITWGSSETTPGGRAVKFWSCIRLDVRKAAIIKEGDNKVGITVKARVQKSSMGTPFGETKFDIYFGNCDCHQKGIDVLGNLLDFALERGVLKKSAGNVYSFDVQDIGRGRLTARAELVRNPKLAGKIRKQMEQQERKK